MFEEGGEEEEGEEEVRSIGGCSGGVQTFIFRTCFSVCIVHCVLCVLSVFPSRARWKRRSLEAFLEDFSTWPRWHRIVCILCTVLVVGSGSNGGVFSSMKVSFLGC